MKNIVITSFDVVSSAGIGIDEFSKNILMKNDFSSEIKSFNTSNLNNKKAFILNDIDFSTYLGKIGLKHINRNSKLAFLSIERKLLNEFKNLPQIEKPGLILGSAFGSVDSITSFWETYLTEGNNSLRPLDFPNTVINAGSSFINIRYELNDISATISSGFNSSLDAFIYAYDYIQSGYGDFLIVGGSEELGKYLCMGQEKSGVISKKGKMLPFDNNHDGYLAGEGSAFFIVESLEHAKKRKANIITELIGFSSYYSTDMEKGVTVAYNEAIKMAGIDLTGLDLISSSANGGIHDMKILKIYKNLFNDHLKNLSITAHKYFFGECYGASGALQIAACLSNSISGKISPVLSDDLIEDLPCFSKTASNKKINYFAVDGISCEGNNTVLIFKNYI